MLEPATPSDDLSAPTTDALAPAGSPHAPGIQPTDLSLPMMLLRARELVMEHFRPFLSENDLTDAQWRVLRVLHEAGALEPTEISVRGQVLTPSLTRILKTLEGRALIERERHRHDGRRHLVRLTQAAVELIDRLTPLSLAGYREIEGRFGRDETKRLVAMLTEFCNR